MCASNDDPDIILFPSGENDTESILLPTYFLNECRLWFFSDVFDTRYSFHVPCSVDDNLSHVNQHSWDCSSGPPYLSNASNTMRLSFRIHVFVAVQRGVHNNLSDLSNMISAEGKLDPESPPTVFYIRSAMTELDTARLYAIAQLTVFSTAQVFVFPFSNSDLVSSLGLLTYHPRYSTFPCTGSSRV